MQERQIEKTDKNRQKPIPRGILRRWLEQDGAPEQPWLNQRLIGAAKEGSDRILLHFLKKGADVDARDDEGKTALMEAAWRNHPELCVILVEKGADVNASDNNGNTPLMYAARDGNTKACLLLIEHGADMNATDKTFQRTPLRWAEDLCQIKTAAFLRIMESLDKLMAKDNFRSFMSSFGGCVAA
jgi:ankyrin repeat protein